MSPETPVSASPAPGPAPSLARVARGVSWTGAGHLASQVLWLVSLLVLAALLPPRDFGVVTLGMVLVTVAGLLVDSGTRGSIIAAPSLTRAAFRGAVALNVAAGAVAALGVALLAEPMTAAFSAGGNADAVRWLSLSILLYALGIAPLALLQKRLEFRRFAIANVASSATASVAAVAAALLGAGVWALVLRQLLWMGLLAALAWASARPHLPPRAAAGTGRRLVVRQPGWIGFLLLALTDYVALNADFLVVGGYADARGLGVYSLAFALAFAPLTQVSWQVGRVLFPTAAATGDLRTVGRRTLRSLRLMALVMLPLVPPLVVLAPEVLPALLSAEWNAVVTPFQLLLIAGVGHALLGVVGESLSGTGRIGFRARANVVWAVALVGALLVLVPARGITGAAIAHLALFVPLAAVYAWRGTRLIGTSARAAGAAIGGIAAAVAIESAAVAAAFGLADLAGAGDPLAAAVAAVVGAAVALAVLNRLASQSVRDARTVLAAALRSSPAPAPGA